MESAFKALGDVMELMTALTIVMNRTAQVSYWWNFQFRVVHLNLIIIETWSRVDFIVCYEWTKRSEFLLAVVHGSPRHSNSSKSFKKIGKKLKYIFMSISGLAESFKTMSRPDPSVTLFDDLFLECIIDRGKSSIGFTKIWDLQL